MVHKRYINRDGKKFGPYYYESYRDKDGNIRKRYIKDYKPAKKDSKSVVENFKIKIFMIFMAVIALLILSFIFFGQD
ncbi:MAG: hypothetical protein KC506_03200, partial [Nanoarchaeota archaeon]|nr:hypothetical protein [Nanoarchaeota archaeon]